MPLTVRALFGPIIGLEEFGWVGLGIIKDKKGSTRLLVYIILELSFSPNLINFYQAAIITSKRVNTLTSC